MTARFNALLAQRAPAEGYPPFLHQARILSAIASVTVLDSRDSSERSELIDRRTVNRVRISQADFGNGILNRIRRRLTATHELNSAFNTQLAKRPDVCIAFDAEAVVAMMRSTRGKEWRIAHLHEHPTVGDSPFFSATRSATRKVLKVLKHADLVTVPDQHRADILVSEAQLGSLPIVVMNCPMILEALPESKLKPWLAGRGSSEHRPIVHYQGGVGPDHCLEEVIDSMPFWKVDADFIIVGHGPPAYLESLRRRANSLGLASRLFFIGRVNYEEVFAFAAGATIGVSILNPTNPNWRYSAGASNKRFEYVALGIPQVTNEGPGISNLFERTGVAITARFDSPHAIARAINVYLENEVLRRETAGRARSLHLKQYNYEKQFAPVLAAIDNALFARRRIGAE